MPDNNIPTENRLIGSISARINDKGAANATLSVRMGHDGIDGIDGFSPTITVETDTKTEYVLRITDINGSYLTPNLYPDVEGLEDIASLVASKIDEDLKEYPTVNPTNLTVEQRKQTFLYTNAVGLNRKIQISEFSLEPETTDKIKKKLQTVNEVPSKKDWKVGDYILLDNTSTENN